MIRRSATDPALCSESLPLRVTDVDKLHQTILGEGIRPSSRSLPPATRAVRHLFRTLRCSDCRLTGVASSCAASAAAVGKAAIEIGQGTSSEVAHSKEFFIGA